MSKPKTRGEARAKIAKTFKGQKVYKLGTLRQFQKHWKAIADGAAEDYANALLTVKIKGRKIPSKKRKKFAGIIGKELIKAMVRQDLKAILDP